VHRLASLLPDGVAHRAEVAEATSTSSVKRWLRNGDLVLLFPGVIALAERRADWVVRARGATLWADAPLSHLSALTAAGLVPPTSGPLHVTVPADRCLRDASTVVAHRSDRRLSTMRFRGLEVVELTRSLVDAWAWAHTPARNRLADTEVPLVRRAVIEGVRAHGLRPAALRGDSDRRRLHAGRAALRALLDLVIGGCQSELEIWGALHVLPGPPETPAWVQQHPVQLADGRRVHLDAAYLEAMVAVELDGAAFHGSREARERDLRRDTALAALGWVVLRFSYARLMADPEGCRREIAAVVRARLVNQ
jgi:hypothetical protein